MGRAGAGSTLFLNQRSSAATEAESYQPSEAQMLGRAVHQEADQFGSNNFGAALSAGVNNQETASQDADLFQRRLDQLLVNFRSETMQEFLGTKKRLGIE